MVAQSTRENRGSTSGLAAAWHRLWENGRCLLLVLTTSDHGSGSSRRRLDLVKERESGRNADAEGGAETAGANAVERLMAAVGAANEWRKRKTLTRAGVYEMAVSAVEQVMCVAATAWW